MTVALVSGFASGGPVTGPKNGATQQPVQERPKPERVAKPAESGAGAEDLVQPEPEAQEQAAPPMRLAMARADLGDAAGTFEGNAGADASQGGDPTANSDLLAQIARCLPPALRPWLPFAALSLAIGPDGRLASAPAVISALPQLSPGDRAAADRVVQAALLCGPYLHPDTLNRVVTVPIDFTDDAARALPRA